MGEPERISVKKAALILGEPVRTIQAKAAAGEIPSAAKLLSPHWTFDEATLRAFVKDREDSVWQSNEKRRPARIGAGVRSMGASRSKASSTDGAYEQAMSKLRAAAMRQNASAR
jgi:hypothetical protein